MRNCKSFLEENIGGNLQDTGLKQCFHRYTTKTTSNKSKIDKWDYIKLNGFCTAMETIEWKATYGMGESICNHIFYKQLIFIIYKEFLQCNSKNTKDPTFKWAVDLNRHFSKKTYKWSTFIWKDAWHH